MQEITIVYPNQLFPKHPAIAAGRPVWLIEDSLFFGNDSRWPAAMHAQKILLHRASRQAYAEELRAAIAKRAEIARLQAELRDELKELGVLTEEPAPAEADPEPEGLAPDDPERLAIESLARDVFIRSLASSTAG
jgi:deoxyribodipyrimidine photolyase-like uncharacterized protein